MKRENDSGEFDYGIYEVYYDDIGNINGWTENSLVPTCPSEDGLLFELEQMKMAFQQETILYKE